MAAAVSQASVHITVDASPEPNERFLRRHADAGTLRLAYRK
jgi:hypothetical protein